MAGCLQSGEAARQRPGATEGNACEDHAADIDTDATNAARWRTRTASQQLLVRENSIVMPDTRCGDRVADSYIRSSCGRHLHHSRISGFDLHVYGHGCKHFHQVRPNTSRVQHLHF